MNATSTTVKKILHEEIGDKYKFDFTEYNDKTYAIRKWIKDSNGQWGRESKLEQVKARIPNSKFKIEHLDMLRQIQTLINREFST